VDRADQSTIIEELEKQKAGLLKAVQVLVATLKMIMFKLIGLNLMVLYVIFWAKFVSRSI
jgi:uncharacterized membrane protein YqjE